MTASRKVSYRFPDTRWSLLKSATNDDQSIRAKAMEEFLQIYMPALKAFLVTVRRLPSDLANDLVHDFIMSRVLSIKIFSGATKEKGRFRNYLLKALNNFVNSKLKREYAIRAREVALDTILDANLGVSESQDNFDKLWVQTVVNDALTLMKHDCTLRGRNDLWEVFQMRIVKPILEESDPANYLLIVERFGIQTPRQAINLLATAKRCYVRHLRSAVSRYVCDEREIDEELADLRRIGC